MEGMTVTPAEVIEKALREHMRLRLGPTFEHKTIPLSGAEAEDAALIAVDALKAAGISLVPTGDLRAYLYRGGNLKAEVDAMNRLREIAGPEKEDPDGSR
jgi:hypothetical protein